MNVLGVIQARVGSSRLKNKIFLEINGKSLLEIQINRLLKSVRVEKWLVASPNTFENKAIGALAKKLNIEFFTNF